MTGSDQALARIAEVQKKYSAVLLKKKHVVGVSIGPLRENGKPTGVLALIVLVDKKVLPEDTLLEDRIPSELDGVPVVVQETGVLEALQ